MWNSIHTAYIKFCICIIHPNMGSTVILKVRICLKPLQPFFHQGSSSFLNIRTPVSLAVPITARFLCTKHTNYNPTRRETDKRNNRQNSRQAGGKHGTIRWAEDELWDGAEERRGKKDRLYPKSVFAAGTAKRTAEMLKRKSPVVPEDEEEEDEEPVRRRDAGTVWETANSIFLNSGKVLLNSYFCLLSREGATSWASVVCRWVEGAEGV